MSTKLEANRVLRELEDLKLALAQAKITGHKPSNVEASKTLTELAEVNEVTLNDTDTLDALAERVKEAISKAPVMHMSFEEPPEQNFLEEITKWFRQEVHPYSMLNVGLQPSIGAGCTLRTTNKFFDFSVRKHLANKKEELKPLLRGSPIQETQGETNA